MPDMPEAPPPFLTGSNRYHQNEEHSKHMEPTSMIIAMGVLALLVIMRRRREGEEP